jgi:predicted NUDIX family phosphoesterase
MSATATAAAPETPPAPAKPIEQILVVPTALFHEVGLFQGCNTEVAPYLSTLFHKDNYSYKPRPEMEKDPSFKQLIPYVIFRLKRDGHTTLYYVYTRTTKQGEERLHGKRSVGVGGHVSTIDAAKGPPYEYGLVRELNEEVTVNCRHDVQAPAALINDDSNDVGKVHLGVAHFCDLVPHGEINLEKLIEPKEPEEMAEAGFQSALWLAEHLQDFESWSQIAINALILNNGAESQLVKS